MIFWNGHHVTTKYFLHYYTTSSTYCHEEIAAPILRGNGAHRCGAEQLPRQARYEVDREQPLHDPASQGCGGQVQSAPTLSSGALGKTSTAPRTSGEIRTSASQKGTRVIFSVDAFFLVVAMFHYLLNKRQRRSGQDATKRRRVCR